MANLPNHILLIEDDRAIARSLQAGLEREGYVVTWKDRGADGLAYAQAHSPHLILLDLRLPDLSGFDVCRQMRQMKLRQPLIMLTARNEEVDRILGLEIGADDYVAKPVSLGELLSRIRAQLRRAYGEFAAAEADVLYAGDLTLSRQRGQALRGGQPLNLTPTKLAPDRGIIRPISQIAKCSMGRKSREKRERRVQRTAARRALRHLPPDSDTSQHVAYCAACGGITMGMQASGLYEGLVFDLPETCPNCDHPTEIITWAEWQSREGLAPPTAPPAPTN